MLNGLTAPVPGNRLGRPEVRSLTCYTQVVIAIKNLYNRCLQTAGRTSIARLKDKDCDLMGQLDFYLR
eukprot:39496-Eustigmatos_ZCMA.PRE.1